LKGGIGAGEKAPWRTLGRLEKKRARKIARHSGEGGKIRKP